jgi:hypothetical protein
MHCASAEWQGVCGSVVTDVDVWCAPQVIDDDRLKELPIQQLAEGLLACVQRMHHDAKAVDVTAGAHTASKAERTLVSMAECDPPALLTLLLKLLHAGTARACHEDVLLWHPAAAGAVHCTAWCLLIAQ